MEYKFRAWNKKLKIMCYDNEDDSSDYWDGVDASAVGLINGQLKFKQDEYIFMPFIQNVNGTDIYLGDIVKACMYGDKEKPYTHEITHRNGTYWFGNWTWLEFLNVFRCVEVIGNKHDKELLEYKDDGQDYIRDCERTGY